jgi:hypothetical protein
LAPGWLLPRRAHAGGDPPAPEQDVALRILGEDVTQIEVYTERVCAAIRQHRASLKNPPKNVDEYLKTLKLQGSLRSCSRPVAMEP